MHTASNNTGYGTELTERYNSGRERGHPLHLLPYETWKRQLGDIAGLRVLDLACGDGYTSRILAQMGAKVVGVDLSPYQIDRARETEEKHPHRLGIEYHVGDVADLDLKEKEFDVVSPSFLFHYAPDLMDLRQLMRRTAAHLKVGGRMVALMASCSPTVPKLKGSSHSVEWVDAPGEGSRVRMHFYDLEGKEYCDFMYYHWKSETYERLFSNCGFSDLRWHRHTIPEQLRSQFPDWRLLQRYNGSQVLTALRHE